jgi:WD40 repeat protein
MNFIITVDSENLLRCWSMKDCQTFGSYKIPMQKRVTAVTVDDESKFVAVGNCVGEVKVLTFASGSVLYNLPSQDKEITSLKFLGGCK